jgi:hypothetical protein
VDVQRALALIDAVNRAFVDARTILDIDAGKGDHVGHRVAVSVRVTVATV